MSSNLTTYLGITIGTGRQWLTYAALDEERAVLALGQGPLEAVLAFAAGQSRALAAVDCAARPNLGLMDRADVRTQLTPPPTPGRWTNMRVAEYQLANLGFAAPRTPGVDQAALPRVKRGFGLVRQLEELGYAPYPAEGLARQWLETPVEAVFWAWLGGKPYPAGTLESRLQRQLALFEQGLPIPDPMDFFEEVTRYRLLKGALPLKQIYAAGECSALAAAQMAWLADHAPEAVMRLGDAREGEIVLPVVTRRAEEVVHPFQKSLD